jgi:Xaa-Pro aminopeptidase
MDRLTKFRDEMKKNGIDAMVIYNLEGSDQPSTWYISGFSGTHSLVFISQKNAYISTDSRYFTQVKEQSSFTMFPITGDKSVKDILKFFIKKEGAKTLGYNASNISVKLYNSLFRDLDIDEIKDCESIIQNMRMIKDSEEIKNMEKAIKISEEALQETLNHVKPGKSETEVCARLEYEMKMRGGELAFPTIAVSGARSALCHGKPSNKKVEEGEFLLFDFGARYNGYCADITRTFSVGTPSDEMVKIYDIVYEAQVKSVQAAKAGIIGANLHNVAWEIISGAGYGDYFGHGLGHSLGMDTHDGVGASPSNKKEIPEGAVITVEPGIYLPEKFGVRIEDDVLFLKNKNKVLTNFDKKLMII